ncbi:hypothetical protein D3C81_2047440 [compost metagenome]
MCDKKIRAPVRVQRLQHFRSLDNPIDTQRTQHDKPQHHHRAEQDADAGRAVFLNQEQRHQYDHG